MANGVIPCLGLDTGIISLQSKLESAVQRYPTWLRFSCQPTPLSLPLSLLFVWFGGYLVIFTPLGFFVEGFCLLSRATLQVRAFLDGGTFQAFFQRAAY